MAPRCNATATPALTIRPHYCGRVASVVRDPDRLAYGDLLVADVEASAEDDLFLGGRAPFVFVAGDR